MAKNNAVSSEGTYGALLLNDMNNINNLVAELLAYRFGTSAPKAFVRTYGCQGNVSDSEKIKGVLQSLGFALCESVANADLVLYNTCAVRENAEMRVFGNVGALKAFKQRNKNGVIVLCGCMMQQESVAEKIRKSYPYVDLVFGTGAISKIPQLLYRVLSGQGKVFDLTLNNSETNEGLPGVRDGAFKAFLPIMYGCDNFCSYCIVPYVRGRERSRMPEAIAGEFEALVHNGYKEITLLGQNVNSYRGGVSFVQLLKKLCEAEGDFLIRFMTSHPKDCTRELIDLIAQNRKIERHLHLPFQSGSNRILKAMNRNYTREQYLDLIEYAKQKIDGLSLTSDVIVGFPGETEEDFEQTLSLVKSVEFTSLYTFIYSKRAGTPAAELPDIFSEEQKKARFQKLVSLQEGIAAERNTKSVGTVQKCLVEERAKSGNLSARTSGNVIVEFAGSDEMLGQFVNLKISGAKTWVVFGEQVP